MWGSISTLCCPSVQREQHSPTEKGSISGTQRNTWFAPGQDKEASGLMKMKKMKQPCSPQCTAHTHTTCLGTISSANRPDWSFQGRTNWAFCTQRHTQNPLKSISNCLLQPLKYQQVAKVSRSTDLQFCSTWILVSWNEIEDFHLDP